MRIQTFSIVAGSQACNARCPFCVSRMTDENGVGVKEPEVHWRNFKKACLLAQQAGVTTAMITSKGEPTLFPGQITQFLSAMKEYPLPFIELQTNGIAISREQVSAATLDEWYRLGLSTVAVSIVHHEPEKNRRIYLPAAEEYIDLPGLIERLHGHGFAVRLAAVLTGGNIDSPDEVDELIRFAQAHRVEQLTVRPVGRPDQDESRDDEIYQWILEHALGDEQVQAIHAHLDRIGTPLMSLIHGAQVYDVDGQNICLTDCLTIDSDSENLRQLIFFPDGHLRYDWQYEGAILL